MALRKDGGRVGGGGFAAEYADGLSRAPPANGLVRLASAWLSPPRSRAKWAASCRHHHHHHRKTDTPQQE